ncbi:NTP transferase domain-containing protein [Aeromicrobium sp. 636]|uniref:NTP transferase domain-containing protein n=1 Tax=Aeromicrobium senzhongii TaxID=2663859 RepID=A0A8I0ETN2_9ACTN|nr:sugar phosphate nucleotidyltransferase [Aeromicrobium sp. 636]MBC9224825.1 NTP transferase domain-containing protein [Aeromicrobium senzhongii]MCQ3996938.1 NTP transferase domain-containing protein [Aeromicrobium sp. 636]
MRRAIVLAGGLGTRLRPAVGDLPKPLVDVGGEPLVAHQLRRLAAAGVPDIVIAAGFGAQQVQDELGDGSRWDVRLTYSREQQPLGTGGALALAARAAVAPGDTVVVVNGDLLSAHDLAAQIDAFERSGADVSIHVREVDDARPYGVVSLDDSGTRIRGFREKPRIAAPGLVNAGTYVMRGAVLLDLPDTVPLSLEVDVFPGLAADSDVRAHRDDAPFLDVGTPDALERARQAWR